MFVDASVIIAVVDREPGYEEIVKRMGAATGPFYISPLVRYEATTGLARRKARAAGSQGKPKTMIIIDSRATVDQFIEEMGAEEIVISAEIGGAAIDAAAKYGKAVGHPAKLNFGDCFAYACAKFRSVELLYKGNDFADTDLA